MDKLWVGASFALSGAEMQAVAESLPTAAVDGLSFLTNLKTFPPPDSAGGYWGLVIDDNFLYGQFPHVKLSLLFARNGSWVLVDSLCLYTLSAKPGWNRREAIRHISYLFASKDSRKRRSETHYAGIKPASLWSKTLYYWRSLTRRRQERWRIYLRQGAGASFKALSPDFPHIYADPFAVSWKGGLLVFCEELPANTERAHISVLVLEEKGEVKAITKVLQTDFHLSFPYVFSHEGVFYMLPAAHESRKITLYRAVDFPYKWERCIDLMEEVVATDSVLFHKDNLWWLFTNLAAPGRPSPDNLYTLNDELYVFYREELLSGEWIAHPQNPVVRDVSCGRNAGAVFEDGGKWFRPAQICTPIYGYGIQLMEIVTLTPDMYVERLSEQILPEDFPHIGISAVHSFAVSGQSQLIDGLSDR